MCYAQRTLRMLRFYNSFICGTRSAQLSVVHSIMWWHVHPDSDYQTSSVTDIRVPQPVKAPRHLPVVYYRTDYTRQQSRTSCYVTSHGRDVFHANLINKSNSNTKQSILEELTKVFILAAHLLSVCTVTCHVCAWPVRLYCLWFPKQLNRLLRAFQTLKGRRLIKHESWSSVGVRERLQRFRCLLFTKQAIEKGFSLNHTTSSSGSLECEIKMKWQLLWTILKSERRIYSVNIA